MHDEEILTEDNQSENAHLRAPVTQVTATDSFR